MLKQIRYDIEWMDFLYYRREKTIRSKTWDGGESGLDGLQGISEQGGGIW